MLTVRLTFRKTGELLADVLKLYCVTISELKKNQKKIIIFTKRDILVQKVSEKYDCFLMLLSSTDIDKH